MRIGLFSDTYLPDVNGVVSSVDTLRIALEKLGHDVYVVCPSNTVHRVTWDGNVLRIPGLKLKAIYGYTIASANHRKAEKMLAELNLDIIHVHTEFGIGFFARKIAKKYHIPIVATYHTFYEDYTHYVNIFNIKMIEDISKMTIVRMSEKLCNGVNALIVPTVKTKNKLYEYGVYNRMYVVPTGLDLDKLRETGYAERKFPEDTFVLCYVGRLAEEKSVDILIQAMELCKRRDLNVGLLVVGDGPDKEKLEQAAKELSVSDMVCFVGKIEHSEVGSYYNQANAFVSASLTETQGLTFIEAMATGLPVLAKDRIALNNVLIDKENGFYFTTPASLVDKTVELMHMSGEESESMKKACYRKADEYSLDNFGKAVSDVYQKTIDDYNKQYKVIRLKVADDFTKIYVIDDEIETVFTITTNDYFDLKISQDQGLTQNQYDELAALHAYAYGYRKAINKLAYKDQSVKEISDMLDEISNLNGDGKRRIMKELVDNDYLNDEKLVQSEIENDQIKLNGKKKTEYNLLKRGVDKDLIDKYINEIDDSFEINRGIEKAQLLLKTIKNRSFKETAVMLKKKLIGAGYSSYVATEVIAQLDLIPDEEKELDNLRNDMEKCRRRYERKYSGYELRQKIYAYLYGKGYKGEDINSVLDAVQENEYED